MSVGDAFLTQTKEVPLSSRSNPETSNEIHRRRERLESREKQRIDKSQTQAQNSSSSTSNRPQGDDQTASVPPLKPPTAFEQNREGPSSSRSQPRPPGKPTAKPKAPARRARVTSKPRGRAKDKVTEEIRPATAPMATHVPKKDVQKGLVAANVKKRVNPHDGSTQILFPTFVEIIARIAYYRYNFTTGHVFTDDFKGKSLYSSLQQMFDECIMQLVESIKPLTTIGTDWQLPNFTPEPIANLTDARRGKGQSSRSSRGFFRASRGGTGAASPGTSAGGSGFDLGRTSTHASLRASPSFTARSRGPGSPNRHDSMRSLGASAHNASSKSLRSGHVPFSLVNTENFTATRSHKLPNAKIDVISAVSITTSIPPSLPSARDGNSVRHSVGGMSSTGEHSSDTTPVQAPLSAEPNVTSKFKRLFVEGQQMLGMEFVETDGQRDTGMLGSSIGGGPGNTVRALPEAEGFPTDMPIPLRHRLKTSPLLSICNGNAKTLTALFLKYRSKQNELVMSLRNFVKMLGDYHVIRSEGNHVRRKGIRRGRRRLTSQSSKEIALLPTNIPSICISPEPHSIHSSRRTSTARTTPNKGRSPPRTTATQGNGKKRKDSSYSNFSDGEGKSASDGELDIVGGTKLTYGPKVSTLMMRVVSEVLDEDVTTKILNNEQYCPVHVRKRQRHSKGSKDDDKLPQRSPSHASGDEEREKALTELKSLVHSTIHSQPGRQAAADAPGLTSAEGSTGGSTTPTAKGLAIEDGEAVPNSARRYTKTVIADFFVANWDYIFAHMELIFPQFLEALGIVAEMYFPRVHPSSPSAKDAKRKEALLQDAPFEKQFAQTVHYFSHPPPPRRITTPSPPPLRLPPKLQWRTKPQTGETPVKASEKDRKGLGTPAKGTPTAKDKAKQAAKRK
eukprot:TRINITY_DN61648_c0_g1_i1.p1 TRINITY_DN61648_c0_g1~~TRINITY_DN61648_c0_g1_i1.p1  ORF type:complete len:1059 (+),score=73.82 TRINITY_DN61648_c0_g1_i1:469-3177(+)